MSDFDIEYLNRVLHNLSADVVCELRELVADQKKPSRAFIAAHALQGLLACGVLRDVSGVDHREQLGAEAVRLADALLGALKAIPEAG